ncbi:MAG: fructose-1,6-bisphosphatase [Clostridiales bacterium]|nr:fructose-1,6-bisphosphatase [Candidatus Crickella caballi]
MADIQYLKLLAEKYPNRKAVRTEIINLRAILALPKATEFVLSDIHGEYDAFQHFVRSGSGMIRMRIDEVYADTLTEQECDDLASLIYNPRAEMARRHKNEENYDKWCAKAIVRLIRICRVVTNKYTRSKVKKRLPKASAYILDELLFTDDVEDRHKYYDEIIESIIEYESADDFIADLSDVISNLMVDRLHIIGDIYDRGPKPHVVMDYLMANRGIDIQWGNHDILWMGAASGNRSCIANAVRINVRYNNFDMLEVGYGINLRPLSSLAQKIYADDPCEYFYPNVLETNKYDPIPEAHAAKMHKMISVIQFKCEGQEIMRHPEYHLDHRMMLDKIDYEAGTIELYGKTYELRDKSFPTIDPKHPYRLTKQEEEVMVALEASFLKSEKLQSHIDYMLSHGSLYTISNGNLFYHGCIPFNDEGELKEVEMYGERYSGRKYLDKLDSMVRQARHVHDEDGGDAAAIMWYLWLAENSPLFGKDKMTTFERYFIEDRKTHKENAAKYYKLIDQESVAEKILTNFGLKTEVGKILNGHVPVKIKDGETPIKGGGKIFIIDGGISKAYRKTTGIAGYTAILTSKHMYLAEHKPYEPLKEDGTQVFSRPVMHLIETQPTRLRISDTDNGAELFLQIKELEELNDAFKRGYIKER